MGPDGAGVSDVHAEDALTRTGHTWVTCYRPASGAGEATEGAGLRAWRAATDGPSSRAHPRWGLPPSQFFDGPMTAGTAATPATPPIATPPIVGSSRWATLSWVLFLIMGALLGLFGISQIAEGINYDDVGGRAMGYDILYMFTGGLLVAIGLLHAVVARSIRGHHSRGRVWGMLIAIPGMLLGLYLLPSAFTLSYTRVPGTEEVVAGPNLLAISIGLFGVMYAIALASLILGGSHFKAQTGELTE